MIDTNVCQNSDPIESSAIASLATAIGQGEDLIGFPELFARQVRLTPNAIAIVHEQRQISYSQLAAMASSFAADLNARGVVVGQFVGLCVDRSPEAIAAMLGVMQTGAAFVPLDPEYPVDRLAYMIRDAQIGVVIAHEHHRSALESNRTAHTHQEFARLEWIDADSPATAGNELADPITIYPHSLAYVMYTSGSTGHPKGVQIEHAALATYCFADAEVYQLTPADRTLQFSTLNFDIAIEEIFPPLISAGTVVIRPRGRSTAQNELSAIAEDYNVTAIHIATAYWHQWVDLMVATDKRVPRGIRLMVVTGEKVSVEHYRRWKRICDHEVLWCNAYGPTEATVSATVFIPDDSFDAPQMPIGKALKRYETLILDADRKKVAENETGELYLSGPALARGYLNRDDLTQAAFIDWTDDPRQAPLRLYRTGDLARLQPDGNIEFAGRIDHQIKLGSYRIEPGEIEAVLDSHPSVRESLVTYEQIDQQKYLIAYVATGSQHIELANLVDYLRASLPPYMVPTRYALMADFPTTINGKIDRVRLDASQSQVARSESFSAPRNDLQRQLATIWQDVLHVPEIGIDDDFFMLGGSSLLVTQVVTRLTQELNIELPVRDFFANPTVATAAQHIAELMGHEICESGDAVAERRERLPKINPYYVGANEDALFCVHYVPPQQRRNRAVVMCHAYGHEYTRSFRNLQQLAIQLCQAGYDVYRFDYRGTGNSGGHCLDATFEQFQGDIQTIVASVVASHNYESIATLGIRIGASALANTPLKDVDYKLLWDPVVCGEQYLADLQRFHERSLTELTRFNQVRHAGPIDQLFGHRMNDAKRASFAAAKLPVAEASGWPDAAAIHVIASRGVFETHRQWEQVRRDYCCTSTSDEIHWHDPEYTESAFASPGASHVIMDLLNERRQR